MEFIQQGLGNGIPCVRTMTSLKHQVGFDTDIGGGRENQDSFFVWSKRSTKPGDENILVCGVLDGHGREVGKVAAIAAKAALLKYFDDHHEQLRINPYECLVSAHNIAHINVKEAFRYES
jgi:serine/threonine protein phosphatase PrpC